MRLWFGKYNSVDIEDVPESYLCWMRDNMDKESLRELAREELSRRLNERRDRHQSLDVDDTAREILQAGYRALAQKYHPDHGGDTVRMQQINSTMDKLRRNFK